MDYICIDDFCNKTKVVIDIYVQNKKALEKYINYIALGLYLKEVFSHDRPSSEPIDEFAAKVNKKIIDCEDKIILSQIIDMVRALYMKYMAESY